jgi:3-hydroxyanthranilate 3,4-dioxygenase
VARTHARTITGNETEELFYQLEGDIEVGIQEDGKAVTIPIKEGEIVPAAFAHPAPTRRGGPARSGW